MLHVRFAGLRLVANLLVHNERRGTDVWKAERPRRARDATKPVSAAALMLKIDELVSQAGAKRASITLGYETAGVD